MAASPPGSLRDRAYHEIKSDIITGVHGSGERLSLDRLADRYQVSKTPVRDALNALQQEGYVEIIPRGGCVISHITVKDVQDVFDLRLILEGASAELAAQHITYEELLNLEGMHSSYSSGDAESYWEYLKENREFHCVVARATRNKQLAGEVERLLEQIQRLIYLRLDLRDSADEMVQEHCQLVATLRSRDRHLARKVMVASIQTARAAVLEAIMLGARLPIQLSE